MKSIKMVTLLSTLFSYSAIADTVKLKNGDWLTGTVIKKETDKLVFKTKYTGEINILWSEIATLNTDKPVKVVLSDDSTFDARLQKRTLGRVKVVNTGLKMSTELDLNDLSYINPSPEVSKGGITWKGYADLGGAITQGNSDTSVLRFDTEGIARTKKNRLTLGGKVNRAKSNDEQTEFNSKGYAQVDHFLSKKWFVYGNGSLEHDRFKNISLRSNVGLGSGYQFYEQTDLNLSVEAGINYVNVDYDQAEDESYASGRWALKYDQLIFSNVRFFHQHEVLISLENSADTLVFTKTGLRVPIAENLNASTQLDIDYDNEPAVGREKADKTLLFSLGYGW
jgi:putative salt-induced outer membrane protein YdiY